MKKCENCGKQHNGSYASGRFCSVKCSRSFSTKGKRKAINEKVSKSLKGRTRVIKKCISCNDILVKRRVKYCKKCKKYVGYKNLFDKLNVLENNLIKSNKKALDILYKDYFIDKLSKLLIMEKYNIMSNTIYNYFKLNGLNLRSLSEANHVSIEEGRFNIPSDIKYKCGTHKTWNGKEVYYRSSYELDYIKLLDKEKIDYDVEKLRIKYYDSQKDKMRYAYPDILLNKSNTIIEIKSDYTLDKINMKDKVKKYRELGYNFKLILEKEEVDYKEILFV